MDFQNKQMFKLIDNSVLFGILVLFCVATQLGYSQSKADSELLEQYGAYTSLSREIVYLHLNKTDFLIGEQLGFKAYVMDKDSRMPSLKTSNLYVQLVDENNRVLREKLLQLKKGVTHGTFMIDSVLEHKDYVIRAFTNWSRNFEEPNNNAQRIRVVELDGTSQQPTKLPKSGLKVSFMPEGGHFINSTLNSLGIRVRNDYGGRSKFED